ncbi:MAG TPA: hypothetical protein VFX79_03030 [Candidatus Saccharimonadales bacterium]|nr:hypothetical protein [Candidatus Saccharimonadales bacterium]
MLKKLILATVTVFAVGAFSVTLNSPTSYADGNGSPDDCKGTNANVTGSIGGSADSVSHDVGSGKVVKGVCIKSGSNMFGGNQHSGVLGNGTYENGCYQITGVGTQQVTVTRLKGGSSCQGISHIDVVVEDKSDFCDPSTFNGSVGNVVPKDVRCVEPNINVVCGALEGAVSNLTPLSYGISWSEGSPDYNFNTSLPASFPEDYNGGSVEVFYWVVGAEADYVTGRNIPNFWEQNAASVTVDTDCDDEEGNGETPRTPLTPTSTDVEEEEQVNAPAGGVNAGSGDAATIATAAVTLIGSLASLAYGVVRFTKFGA